MDKTLYERLEEDVRFREGLNSCMNCGVCTAICPAAEVSDYDPRMVVSLVQQKDESELEKLLKSNTIWRCGECLSCKPRCPRGNVPCYIIQALRALSVETGGTQRFEKIEKYSSAKADELNIDFNEGKDDYFKYLYNE